MGTPTWRGAYAPFGHELASWPTLNRYKFTGKERDAESGLDYFSARFYSSDAGRFMSSDPAIMTQAKVNDPQQWNMYSYGRNNPVTYVDFNGKWRLTFIEG